MKMRNKTHQNGNKAIWLMSSGSRSDFDVKTCTHKKRTHLILLANAVNRKWHIQFGFGISHSLRVLRNSVENDMLICMDECAASRACQNAVSQIPGWMAAVEGKLLSIRTATCTHNGRNFGDYHWSAAIGCESPQTGTKVYATIQQIHQLQIFVRAVVAFVTRTWFEPVWTI